MSDRTDSLPDLRVLRCFQHGEARDYPCYECPDPRSCEAGRPLTQDGSDRDEDMAVIEHLRERVASLEEALREIRAIGAAPIDSMTPRRREYKRRGQVMLNIAHRALEDE
jgi:hypothetical protein